MRERIIIITSMEGGKVSIKYIKGDATAPIGGGGKVIVHITNTLGSWGKGFVLALSKRWKKPEQEYKQLVHHDLGEIQMVQVEEQVWVANMIAQNGIQKPFHPKGMRYVDYNALRKCLGKVRGCLGGNKSVHMPRIGVGLGGGSWPEI